MGRGTSPSLGLKQKKRVQTAPAPKKQKKTTTTVPSGRLGRSRCPETSAVERTALVGWKDVSDAEVLLRKFDMDPKFGPCVGLSRMDRWNRASRLGLDPPAYLLELMDGRETPLWK